MTTLHRLTGAARLVLLSTIVFVLSACSALRVAYQQLDWMIEKQVGEYVTLDREQARMLDARIEALLDWHCRTQVRDYAHWLRQVNDDLQGNVTARRLLGHSSVVEDAWHEIIAYSIPAMADLADSLSDDQVRELLAKLQHDSKEYREEFVDPPEPELRKAGAKWMRKSLRRWLGALSEHQKDSVKRWSQELSLMGAAGWRNRVLWQDELIELLENRHDRAAFVAGLERLLLHWRDHQGAEYRRRYDRNGRLTAELLADISRSMTPTQQRRLAKKALRYAADLEALHCAANKPGATAGGRSPWRWIAIH